MPVDVPSIGTRWCQLISVRSKEEEEEERENEKEEAKEEKKQKTRKKTYRGLIFQLLTGETASLVIIAHGKIASGGSSLL